MCMLDFDTCKDRFEKNNYRDIYILYSITVLFNVFVRLYQTARLSYLKLFRLPEGTCRSFQVYNKSHNVMD